MADHDSPFHPKNRLADYFGSLNLPPPAKYDWLAEAFEDMDLNRTYRRIVSEQEWEMASDRDFELANEFFKAGGLPLILRWPPDERR